MKKFLSVTLILALALTLCLSFAACKGQEVDTVQIDYSTVLPDYLKYPDEANIASMNKVERNVADIYADSSLTDAEKVAQMMARATKNEIECAYFAYFIDRIGETKMNSNHGQLIYQRLRRQSDTLKDDTTIKLPVNHNFDAIASRTLTDAKIRYVKDGKYYKITNKSGIIYDDKTGLLTVDNWKRTSPWGEDQSAKSSRSDEEARKTCINWNAKNIVDSKKTVKIDEKTDDNGNAYYELVFSVDVKVANADGATIKMLENDNGGSGMKYQYCDFVVQIWKVGLAKYYDVKESWSGKIVAYSGAAQCESKIVFSYSEDDLKDTGTNAIYQKIKK
ncbi:MAG: hypothetical protein K2M75_01605 [Clostridia bacterium]|nr:hypothetical protein [Clostridia bacterium]